jgi:hypothetical protein
MQAWGQGNINPLSFRFSGEANPATINGFVTTPQLVLVLMARKGLLNKKSLKHYEENYAITEAGNMELIRIKKDKLETLEYTYEKF